jgi:hypothetical protein
MHRIRYCDCVARCPVSTHALDPRRRLDKTCLTRRSMVSACIASGLYIHTGSRPFGWLAVAPGARRRYIARMIDIAKQSSFLLKHRLVARSLYFFGGGP